MTVDGVHLKVQGKHFYDFKAHHVDVNAKGPFDDVKFEIKSPTVFLVEGPDCPSARNMRTTLNNALLEKYEYGLDVFMRGFTIVTDGAAVMARVANASVSRDIHRPDET